MFPYWILFTVFAAGAASTRKRLDLTRWNPLFVVAGMLATLMIGLRFEVGADWYNYQRIFLYTGFQTLGDAMVMVDPGYALLNWLVYKAEWGIWVVNFVCAAILTWGLLKFANTQPNPWLCILVAVPYLMIVVGMGYTRQAAALGFILAGLAHFGRQGIARFILFAVLAAAFHKTAIVVLPLVAFASVQNRALVVAAFAGLGFLLFTFFLERAMTIISAAYLDQEYDASGALIRTFMNVLPAIIFLLFGNRFGLEGAQFKLWRNFAMIALALVPMLFITTSSVIVDRLAIYLIPLQLLVFGRLPWAFPDGGKPNGQIALGIIIYSAVVQTVWLNAASHAEYWLPYQIYPIGQDVVPVLDP